MASIDVTRIASNIGAANALSSLTSINKQLAIHQTRLATGKRINSAGDDPAGYTIATKMLARSEGLKVSLGNISDAKNLLSTAESGLSKMNDILVQMRGKAEQAASDTLGVKERQAVQTQLSSYAEQIDAIVDETKWNNTKLLGGNVTKRFQTGADNGEYTDWTLTQSHRAVDLGISRAQAQDATASVAVAGTVAEASKFATMPELADGTYSFTVLASAAAAATGYAAQTNTVLGVTDVVANGSGGTAANVLANGANEITLTEYAVNGAGTTGTLTYSYTASDGTAVGPTDSAAIALTNGAGTAVIGTSGISIAVDSSFSEFDSGAATDPDAVRTVKLNYVQEGMAQMQLSDSDGNIISVDANGNGVDSGSAMSFYVSAGAAFDTGKGVALTSTAVGLAEGAVTTFAYKRENDYSMDVSTADAAATYMDTVNNAIDLINSDMADLGSLVARMTFKEDQIQSSQINVESSYSRIMDANMAEEQVNASKFSILQQTATAMLAQANQAPQTLLSLFR